MKEVQDGGNCFDENGRYFLDHAKENWKLVHGIVINSVDQMPMTHCWIEIDNEINTGGGRTYTDTTCIDKSNGNNANLNSNVYYYFGKIQDTVKYNRKEFSEKLLQHKTWGPWDIDAGR